MNAADLRSPTLFLWNARLNDSDCDMTTFSVLAPDLESAIEALRPILGENHGLEITRARFGVVLSEAAKRQVAAAEQLREP